MISFEKINPIDVLICEHQELSLNIKNLKIKELVIDKIYIRYIIDFLIAFLFNKKLTLFQCYKQIVLRILKPKILISNNLSGRGLEYKKLYPNAKLILYQFGYVNQSFLERKNIKNLKSQKLDYFFTFHKKDTDIMKKKFTAKFIEAGSVRNNSLPTIKKKLNQKKIVFISEFNPFKKNFLKNHTFVVKLLNNFCKNYNIKFDIALRLSRKDKINSNKLKKISVADEINYFNKLLKEKIEFKNISSFSKCSNANISVTLSSNLGVELLSRDKKVMFFNLNQIISKKKIIPYLKKNDCLFIHSNYKISDAYKKLEKLLNISTSNWIKIKKKYFFNIKFDKKNKILKKKILEILSDEKN